ncbi:MAG: AGE family epimerase/isomerase [Bacteroidia bacterium]|nr:AGE family epimerase/isomerase [Bacteroidia bacterium]
MKNLSILFPFLLIALLFGCKEEPPEEMLLSSTVEQVLMKKVLEPWYPRVIDSLHGGYLSDFDYAWERTGKQNKMIVTQARHVWTTSKAYNRSGDEGYKAMARHGVKFLKDVMWDAEYGGFLNLVNQEGEVLDNSQEKRIIKEAYGNAFAIYALAAFSKISDEEKALDYAKSGFYWLEEYSHDSDLGGYFQFMERDGRLLRQGSGRTPPKDQNSSIHLLEAFSELYGVWRDDLLKSRIEELISIIRDTITHEKGYMRLHFWEDWTPLSYRDSTQESRENNHYLDHVSFGHDIETAYLLLEAEEVIGEESERTHEVAKKMVDHALRFGFDDSLGGLYDGGYYLEEDAPLEIVRDSKNWWAQVETLNTLQLMEGLYPNDSMKYGDKFLKQWDYIDTYLIDHEQGGFYAGGLDKEPERKEGNKSGIWKGAYHTARSLLNVVERMEK